MPTRRDFLTLLAASAAVDPACIDTASADPPVTSGSDIGSLYPFIAAQSARCQRSGLPVQSCLQPAFSNFEAWRKLARSTVFESLHYAPPKCAIAPKLLSREERDGYTQENIEFSTTPDIRVPAAVLIPKGRTKPGPAVVALHDHGAFYFYGREKLLEDAGDNLSLTAFRKQYYGGHSIAVEMVKRGYVVIVIDMFYWGERRLLLDKDPDDWRTRPDGISPERITAFNRRSSELENLTGRTIYAAGFTWPGVMFWDDIRTVDYLCSRPDVDPKRIACVGLSVGGFRSCHLAALDPRIKASVVVGWMTSFPHQLKKNVYNTIGHSMLVPGLYNSLDYCDVACIAAPSAMLVINGSKDGLFDRDGVNAAFKRLHAGYKKAGHPDKVRTLLFDTPHEFNTEMQAEAWDWLKKWL